MTAGNRNILNIIKGVASVLQITASEKTTLANKVLPANILIIDNTGVVYLTDGATALSKLQPLKMPASKDDIDRVISTTYTTKQETSDLETSLKSWCNDAIVNSAAINGLSVSGKVITYTKTDGTSGTITTYDSNNVTAQNISTADSTYPILLGYTANATANIGNKATLFGKDVKINPSTGTIVTNAITLKGNDLQGLLNNKSDTSHTHDDRYYTESEIDTKLAGSISGNAATATKFSANQSVTLTGDVTGTASSTAGWSVTTTLANSGVTAGTYGPTADVTGSNNTTIDVPQITVDAKGRITDIVARSYKSVNNTYSSMSATEITTGTATTARSISAKVLNDWLNGKGYLTEHQDISDLATKTELATKQDKGNYVTTDTQQYINDGVSKIFTQKAGNGNHVLDVTCNLSKGVVTNSVNHSYFNQWVYGEDGQYLGYTQYWERPGETPMEYRIGVRQAFSNGALDPDGSWITSGLQVGVDLVGQPYIRFNNYVMNDIYPKTNNGYSLGTNSYTWKSVYANAYYLGTTKFGDIVTHNSSEYLTTHQTVTNKAVTLAWGSTSSIANIGGVDITVKMPDSPASTYDFTDITQAYLESLYV